MTATSERGEVTLSLAGQEYVLRPSFEACSAIEQQTGQSLMQLAVQADGHELSMEHAAVAATEFIRAWGRETGKNSVIGVQKEKIARLIFEEGLMAVVVRLAIVLTGAVTGGTIKSDDDEEDGDQGET